MTLEKIKAELERSFKETRADHPSVDLVHMRVNALRGLADILMWEEGRRPQTTGEVEEKELEGIG